MRQDRQSRQGIRDQTLPQSCRHRRDITRDAANNVTRIALLLPNNSTGEFDAIQQTDLTYTDGQAYTIVNKELDTSTTPYGWKDVHTYSNIKWVRTDGQILYDFSDGLDHYLHKATSPNLLQSLTIFDHEEDLTMQAEATFTDNDGYTLTMTTPEGESAITNFSCTDDNGSYAIVTSGEGYSEIYRIVFDEHKSITLEEEFYEEDGYNETSGVKYDYEYDRSTGVVTKQIVSEYDSDEEAYLPVIMIESSDIQNVASAGIVAADNDCAYAVYTANRRLVTRDRQTELSSGLYIVKAGSIVSKILVK